MESQELILVEVLCHKYEIDMNFFEELESVGLIEFHLVKDERFIAHHRLSELEKMLRLHQDLNVNLEGIDVVLNLLNRVGEMNAQMNSLKNRLRLYENMAY